MDHLAQLKEAVAAARDNGWVPIDGRTVRRMTERPTPEDLPPEWWSEPTYSRLEFLTFTFFDRGRVPLVIYGVAYTPWTGRSDQKVSFKRALELLSQPLEDSDVHS